ncbi:hypothetical protein AAK894_13775 [Lachnospiraceae bacterium 46-61]
MILQKDADFYIEKADAILDELGQKSGWYKQIVAKVDFLNGNDRLYPKQVYQYALEELKREGFPYAGEHPHPKPYRGTDGNIYFTTSIPHSAVKFRDAYIDEQNNVWAEYKPLDTEMGRQVKTFLDNGLPIGFSNRMRGTSRKENRNGKVVQIAKKLKLYTWDVVLNPAEKSALQLPIVLDEIEEENMDFFDMSLKELEKWKEQNKNAEKNETALCDSVIALKKQAEYAEQKVQAMNEEIETKKQKEETQKILLDEVEKLNYTKNVKNAILKKGASISDKENMKKFLKQEKDFLDALEIENKLRELGMTKQQGRTKAIVTEGKEFSILDSMMEEMDKELQKKNNSFFIDKELRKANSAIVDSVLKSMERKKDKETKIFLDALKKEKNAYLDETTPVIADTGAFAQSANISLAILKQAWQDIQFLQLCMVEGFSGSTYKMPVEFQSHDLYSEDDFAVGELDSIPTENVQTFLLEFGAQWLKKGFIVTKEAQKELLSGTMRYDVIAANAASIANRFQRIIDRMISTEMLARADEYGAKQVAEETVSVSEVEELTEGKNIPEGSNAKWKVNLLCGNTSPLSAVCVAPIVRPRKTVWLDQYGRKQEDFINTIVVKNSSGKVLTEGIFIRSKCLIADKNGKVADYAVDFENACIYFKKEAISKTALPKVSYSYATNIVYFNLAMPKALENYPARYYNGLLELIDTQKAYMGSTPRYVTPDFCIGSLNAMTMLKQAELFYQKCSPNGTTLCGEGYFAKRNGIDLVEHNIPWAAGDGRILLGKKNAVRVGMGSPYELEGPYPYIAEDGQYTSAKMYFATQQIAINTPLVIDEKHVQYHPPFRTIKFYSKEQ